MIFQSSGNSRSRRFWGRAQESESASSPPLVNQVILLPLDCIVPNSGQPRRTFSAESLQELAQSIEENGLLQPITVRVLEENENGRSKSYELIAGERRLRAFRLLGQEKIPAIVERLDSLQSHVLALIENIQRDDLSYFDQALAIRSLMEEHSLTQAEIARRLGMAQSTVANKLRLLRLDEDLRLQITAAGFTERHARCLLLLPSPQLQKTAVEEIIRRGMNVAQTEQYIQHLIQPGASKGQASLRQSRRFVPKDVRIFVNTINHAIETMQNAGIEACAEHDEDEHFIHYSIRIAKELIPCDPPSREKIDPADALPR